MFVRTAVLCMTVVRDDMHTNVSSLNYISVIFRFFIVCLVCLQCFDAVGWAAGRASGL